MADMSLEAEIAAILKEKGYKLALAESCTGGMIAARMVNVPGVSEVFETGFVTYANAAKIRLLGVREETLSTHGAVSAQTAEEMARGAAKAAYAQAAIGVTGIAGPDGGTEEKPVGLVYIGCYVNGTVQVEEYRFKGNRESVRKSAAETALVQMRRCLLDH